MIRPSSDSGDKTNSEVTEHIIQYVTDTAADEYGDVQLAQDIDPFCQGEVIQINLGPFNFAILLERND